MQPGNFNIPAEETRINSSNLESIQYDKEAGILYIRFVGSPKGKYAHAKYAYDAPVGFYDTILEINNTHRLRGKPMSVGEWFAQVFRNTEHFKTSRIVDQPFA